MSSTCASAGSSGVRRGLVASAVTLMAGAVIILGMLDFPPRWTSAFLVIGLSLLLLLALLMLAKQGSAAVAEPGLASAEDAPSLLRASERLTAARRRAADRRAGGGAPKTKVKRG